MKFNALLLLLIFSAGTFAQGMSNTHAFEKSGFYAAMASESLNEINSQLTVLKAQSFPEKQAYEGALLMKKAGIVNGAKEKISLFKSGRSKLEASIGKESNNVEYRFLRLMIQEHAPKIVKYRSNVEEDSKIILSNFKNLSPTLQQVITDYSKNSTALKTL